MIALNILAVAIGIGLLFTLLLAEAFGIAAGGLVVPGYIALQLMRPWTVAMTLLAAYLAFVLVRILSGYMILYGRRKTALIILSGYVIGALLELTLGGLFTFPADPGVTQGNAAGAAATSTVPTVRFVELSVVGYIIPGLIAIWFDRQGVVQTLAGLVLTAVLVRLTLIVFLPDLLMTHEASLSADQPRWLAPTTNGG